MTIIRGNKAYYTKAAYSEEYGDCYVFYRLDGLAHPKYKIAHMFANSKEYVLHQSADFYGLAASFSAQYLAPASGVIEGQAYRTIDLATHPLFQTGKEGLLLYGLAAYNPRKGVLFTMHEARPKVYLVDEFAYNGRAFRQLRATAFATTVGALNKYLRLGKNCIEIEFTNDTRETLARILEKDGSALCKAACVSARPIIGY